MLVIVIIIVIVIIVIIIIVIIIVIIIIIIFERRHAGYINGSKLTDTSRRIMKTTFQLVHFSNRNTQ